MQRVDYEGPGKGNDGPDGEDREEEDEIECEITPGRGVQLLREVDDELLRFGLHRPCLRAS